MKNLFLLGALLIPTIVYSANDLERWNSEVGRTVRQAQSEKLAQTTYSEISSKNVTVSQDMKTVYPQIETNAQVAGSRTRVVAEATLVVDKDKVWKDWNKKLSKFGRGTAAGVAAGAIVQGIVDGVGWVIDEGGKVTKKNTDTPFNDPSVPYYYSGGGFSSSSESGLASKILSDMQSTFPGVFVSSRIDKSNPAQSNILICREDGNCNQYQYAKVENPNYNPSSPPPESVEVSEAEKEQVLKNLLNDPKHADLAADMIGNTYSMGPDNPEPDPDVVNDLKNKQKDVLKSDNPKGDGKTRTDPKIDTGTQGQADTTPKPDTGTGTNPDTGTGTTPSSNTGSTTNFELPAFCNYAAKLCDWLDWTQEDKELEEAEKEEPEELDLGTIDKNRFRANGQCPAPIQVNESVRSLGKSVDFDLMIEWTQICNVAEDTSPLVLLISTITGLLILVGGGRSGES
ncbi:virulence factor TspB C-terminal domain-related protein [Acinetobacter johnsonii]|uniref:virulence factor TspB C-terminal domain-related protein n=1 Tax=Acinetobacter johnsonii TaxID=40214 RepID=UPI002448B055|nr:virulence factor TspB C-terminal domain-related protein [Acinetobacter johnsonii]MDH0712947.1 virulence factor TspB C-terminal domain-related protein [Acinetobacter johnsonii]